MGLLGKLARGASRFGSRALDAVDGAGAEIGQMYKSGYVNPVQNTILGGISGAGYGAATGQDPLQTGMMSAAAGGLGGTAMQAGRFGMRGALDALKGADNGIEVVQNVIKRALETEGPEGAMRVAKTLGLDAEQFGMILQHSVSPGEAGAIMHAYRFQK